ncbi:MAG: hypothetical protein ABSC18_00675 [Verrucomicrobiota bacterium]|jgi:hypothetical protein
MNRLIALLLAAAPFLSGCASNVFYRPGSRPESAEMRKDMLDVYPGDIRQNPDLCAGAGVGWAGIITRTEAQPGPDGLIHAVTTFEHHYFDWQEDRRLGHIRLNLSPRGEGLFRTEWVLRRNDPAAGKEAAESFAGPGKLAIVYGVPEKVEDGTVVLRYRFLRVVEAEDYSTNKFDYGRFGEPFRYIGHPPEKP